jgi:histidinol-phosphate phosphatase family protein
MTSPAVSDGPRRLRRALFVDRDGTLNPDPGYINDPARLELYRGVGDALRLVHAHGELVVCVTNQSGIERGFYTHDDVARIHARLNELLARDGAHVDAFYYCPHHPDRGCDCRKPGTALFERARAEWNIDLPSSALIGDRLLDVEAGRRAGLLTALVRTPGHEARIDRELREASVRPDLIAPSFASAVLRLLARG